MSNSEISRACSWHRGTGHAVSSSLDRSVASGGRRPTTQTNLFSEQATGTRTQGGQLKRYKDSLNRSLKACSIPTIAWETVAADRDRWMSAIWSGVQSFQERRLTELDKKRQARKERTINFWFDKPLKPSTAKMRDLLDVFNLSQSVKEPTHIKGHILDWVIFNPDTDVLRSTSMSHDLSSDHYAVCLNLNIDLPAPVPVYKELRSLRSMDKSVFRDDLQSLVSSPLSSTADQLDSTLRETSTLRYPDVW